MYENTAEPTSKTSFTSNISLTQRRDIEERRPPAQNPELHAAGTRKNDLKRDKYFVF